MADRGACYVQRRRITSSGVVRGVPSWEKRFCWEVGSLPWKRLVNAKKYIYDTHRVILWDDSAGAEAFNNAKHRYWLKMNGLPCRIPLPSADMFIDKIEWNPKSKDSERLQCLDEASTMEKEEQEKVRRGFEVQLDQIKPTGWDCDYGDPFDRRNRVLTGMIVGEYD